jgi:hypothetical protein
MLRARRAGALWVARVILSAGHREVWQDATALSLDYLSAPNIDAFELQSACFVIRDFGTDQQFGRLLEEIQRSQYRDQRRYDKLWGNILYSDSSRERAVLEILLQDDRIAFERVRYSDIARTELTRIQQLKH